MNGQEDGAAAIVEAVIGLEQAIGGITHVLALHSQMLTELLAIASNESSRVLAITLQAGEAQLAADVVNELMQQYLADDRSARVAIARQAYEELDAEANAAGREVEQAEATIDQFRQHHDVVSLQAGLPAALQLNDQQARLAAANLDLTQAQATLEASRRAQSKLSSPALQSLHDRETDVLQRTALATQFGLSNPRRIALEDELRSVAPRSRLSGASLRTRCSATWTLRNAG